MRFRRATEKKKRKKKRYAVFSQEVIKLHSVLNEKRNQTLPEENPVKIQVNIDKRFPKGQK